MNSDTPINSPSAEQTNEFQAFLQKLQITATAMKAHKLRQVSLPNLIFVADPGTGITHNLHTLLEQIKALHLMTLTGEEECFEWTMSDNEDGLEALLERIDLAGGFYGQFRGIIGLDVSELLKEGHDDRIMEHLMEFVDARQGEIMFVFIVPSRTSKSALQRLLRAFASRTPSELIHIPQLDIESGYTFLIDKLTESGLCAAITCESALKRCVVQLQKAVGFTGYQTLQNLRDEIIWRKISDPNSRSSTLSDQDIAFIFEPGGFIERVNAAGMRAGGKIGFNLPKE